jgi:hypothetical protein
MTKDRMAWACSAGWPYSPVKPDPALVSATRHGVTATKGMGLGITERDRRDALIASCGGEAPPSPAPDNGGGIQFCGAAQFCGLSESASTEAAAGEKPGMKATAKIRLKVAFIGNSCSGYEVRADLIL